MDQTLQDLEKNQGKAWLSTGISIQNYAKTIVFSPAALEIKKKSLKKS